MHTQNERSLPRTAAQTKPNFELDSFRLSRGSLPPMSRRLQTKLYQADCTTQWKPSQVLCIVYLFTVRVLVPVGLLNREKQIEQKMFLRYSIYALVCFR